MRMFSSQSRVMNDQVGSSSGWTTVRLRSKSSAIAAQ